MARLSDLGFSKNLIVETIVSTYDAKGQPNAAPMGVTLENGKHLSIMLYVSSRTFKNIQSNKCAVFNVSSNIDMFYATAFKETALNCKLPERWFKTAKTVNAPRLQDADATIEACLTKMAPVDEEKARATFEVKLIEAKESLPKAYCRAQFATLEAIIHATRVKIFLQGDEKKRAQALQLIETIAACQNVVNRTAPNSYYAEIMADINKKIDSWRNK